MKPEELRGAPRSSSGKPVGASAGQGGPYIPMGVDAAKADLFARDPNLDAADATLDRVATLQTAIMFLGMQVLDSAVEDASRMVKTGRAQAAGYSLANFRTLLCGYTYNLFDCNQIKIKVQKITNFTSATPNATVQTCSSSTCTWTITEAFAGGAGRDIIQVSAYYRWPLMIVMPYFNLKNQPDNYRLISAIRVFRNEPFL